MNKDFLSKVRSLPAKQQIALWVILKHFHTESGTWFTAPDFADKAKRYIVSSDKEAARTLGGILSSLVRNEMIEQLSGGRKPVWQVVPELHKHAAEYMKAIFPTITYWESGK